MGKHKKRHVIKLDTLGMALVKEATKAWNMDQQRAVLDEVKDVLRKISECDRTEEIAKAGRRFFKRQMEAIEAGQFKFSLYHKGKIIYEDTELNGTYQIE